MPIVQGIGEQPHLLPLQQPGPNTAPQSGQPSGEVGHEPPLVPGGGPSHAPLFFLYPERQSKAHAPLTQVRYPFVGGMPGHGSHPVGPQPTFGEGAAHTPPHSFCSIKQLTGPLEPAAPLTPTLPVLDAPPLPRIGTPPAALIGMPPAELPIMRPPAPDLPLLIIGTPPRPTGNPPDAAGMLKPPVPGGPPWPPSDPPAPSGALGPMDPPRVNPASRSLMSGSSTAVAHPIAVTSAASRAMTDGRRRASLLPTEH
jgi:hypothetical protein